VAEAVSNRSAPLLRTELKRSGSGGARTLFDRPDLDTLLRIGHRLALALTILLVCGVAGLYAVRAIYSGKVLPSVYVADIPVGGLTKAEAQAAVDTRASALLNATMVFDYDGRQWTTTLGQLGVASDTSASVEQAFAIGREDDTREQINSTLHLAQSDQVVPLRMVVDSGMVRAWVDQVTAEIGRQPSDARIVVDGSKVTVQEEVDGIVVDQDRLQAIIAESIESMTPYRGALPITMQVAKIHAADLESEVAILQNALSKPITIVYKKKSWELKPEDISPFIVQTPRSGQPGVDVSIDTSGLGQWLFGLVGERINREPVDATVQWSNEKEKVVALTESSKGIRLLSGPLADAVAASFFASHDDVEIPVKGIAPEIDSDHLDKLNITQRLAVGTSAFWGSDENRATNIRVGTQHLNGTLIKPGAEFSFNDAVGDITAEAGYVEAAVVDGERIGKDVGGGICQVSTTVFRAAFLAGMPIGEWWPHLYRLAFYEYDGWQAGLDASILQSGPREQWGDFTFTNATDGHLLIEAYVDEENQTDVVVIYGPDTGWNVDVSEPRTGDPILGEDMPDIEIVDEELPPGTWIQSEYRQDGLEISYVRTVTDREGNVIDEWIAYSRFAARGDVYKVSPDMKGKSPAQDNYSASDI
jgi:vancomycin resistance protein YoaR